jgi:hypothetical protein
MIIVQHYGVCMFKHKNNILLNNIYYFFLVKEDTLHYE